MGLPRVASQRLRCPEPSTFYRDSQSPGRTPAPVSASRAAAAGAVVGSRSSLVCSDIVLNEATRPMRLEHRGVRLFSCEYPRRPELTQNASWDDKLAATRVTASDLVVARELPKRCHPLSNPSRRTPIASAARWNSCTVGPLDEDSSAFGLACPHYSRLTSRAFLSLRKAMNFECRRWCSPVHSRNSNCPTGTGFSQRRSFILAAVSSSHVVQDLRLSGGSSGAR
jgi:hypothetical protein